MKTIIDKVSKCFADHGHKKQKESNLDLGQPIKENGNGYDKMESSQINVHESIVYERNQGSQGKQIMFSQSHTKNC